MNSLRPLMKVIWDCIVVIFGILMMIFSFISPESGICSCLSDLAGVLGILYTLFVFFLVVIRRPLFDWHLVNGNYILKVIAIVLLVPFSLSLAVKIVTPDLEAEDLVYESNRDVSREIVDTLKIEYKDSLSINVPLYADEVNGYSLSSIPSTVPESQSSRQENTPIFWSIYYHFIDPGNQHMTASKDARKWSALIAILGVFLLNGLLVSSIVGWIDSRKERWIKGDVTYKGFLNLNPHYVIIGANDMVEGIVQQLLSKDASFCDIFKSYILIQTSQDVERFRQDLFSNLTTSQQKRVIICYGKRTSRVDIKDLCLRKAKEVYILGEDARIDDIESYHDTMNMECLKLISENISNYSGFVKKENVDKRLVCRVMFEYQTSFNVFKVTDINADKIMFLPFNYYEKWAQNVLICQKTDPDEIQNGMYLPLEGPYGIKFQDKSFVHVIIVGMSRMGIAMAIESAHLAHFPNYKDKRTRITFIDKNADEEKDFFMSRFKALFALSHWRFGSVVGDEIEWNADNEIKDCDHLGGDFIDVEWEFIKGSVESYPVQQYIVDSSKNQDARLTIAVCIPENSRAIAAAAYLPDSVYQSTSTLQVLVYQRLNDELVRQISANNGRYSKKIKAFGMAKSCYDSDLDQLSEHMSKAISKAYTDYKKAQNQEKANSTKEDVAKHTQLDNGNKTGKSLAARMWSNDYNIHSMWTKFRCITTADDHIFNPLKDDFDGVDSEMMALLGQIEHNRWNLEQLLLRFRPLTKEEQDEARIVTLNASDVRKEEYKTNFAHLDICSNEVLDSVDYNMSNLDKALIMVLPSAYRQFKKENDR